MAVHDRTRLTDGLKSFISTKNRPKRAVFCIFYVVYITRARPVRVRAAPNICSINLAGFYVNQTIAERQTYVFPNSDRHSGSARTVSLEISVNITLRTFLRPVFLPGPISRQSRKGDLRPAIGSARGLSSKISPLTSLYEFFSPKSRPANQRIFSRN